jgi:ribonuclease-3
MEELQEQLGYRFKDLALLQQALTHSSCTRLVHLNSQRLEFLGDAVLNFVVAAYLFRKYRSLPVGTLSRIRAALVCKKALEAVAKNAEVMKYVRRGPFLRKKDLSAEAVEAIYGAIFLEAGIEVVSEIIIRNTENLLADGVISLGRDPKSLLQEKLQKKRMKLPVYTVLDSTNYDAVLFKVSCHIACLEMTIVGSGKNKKEAEANAAKKALARLVALPKHNGSPV